MHRTQHENSFAFQIAPDPRSDEPLYRQVCQRFKSAILNGSYPSGARVPSIRTLAAELEVSRGTIERAYDLLIGEGFLASNGQAGTVVSSLAPRSPASRHTVASQQHLAGAQGLGACRSPFPFEIGLPAMDAFPQTIWQSLTQRILRSRAEMAEVAPPTQGHLPLREAIAAYLNVSRGVRCTPAQIFVTSGYRQSVSLLACTLLAEGDTVLTEDPAFPMTRDLLERLRMRQVPVRVDGDGFDVDIALNRAPTARMAMLTPGNQSPMGCVLSLPRRRRLLEWAVQANAWLVEDDYDTEYCCEGRMMPTLTSLDRRGRTFYLGTFSKTLHPTLRLAYVVAPATEAPRLREVADTLLDGSPLLMQKALAAFMIEGHFGRHLKRMRGLYGRRRQMVIEALTKRLGTAVRVDPLRRGLSLLLMLPRAADDALVARKAALAGLAVASLSSRAIRTDCGPGLLLGFANFQDARQVERAVEILAGCLSSTAPAVGGRS